MSPATGRTRCSGSSIDLSVRQRTEVTTMAKKKDKKKDKKSNKKKK